MSRNGRGHATPVSRWLSLRLGADRFIGAVAGAATAPLVGVLATLVRRDDGAPGLITVARVGRGTTPFGMWKIRSMRPSVGGNASGPALTSTQDDRITPMGRRIRSAHLDELPQLLNVARGEMALLGPRPEAPQWIDPAERRWDDVLRVPPGIAGPTQFLVADWERVLIDADPDGSAYVREVVPVKLAIDGWYVRTASPFLDLLVVVSLVTNAATGRPLRALERRIRQQVPEAAPTFAWLDEHRAVGPR